MVYYKFNCKTRKFEDYAKGKIISAKGIITSIDWEKMSVVIKGNKDLKETLYKISDRYKSSDRITYFLEDIESTKKKLQKGKSISFGYTAIDGKNIFLGIDPWHEKN
jgi:uncharacterized membrane protein YjjP (DUF1212 family)